MVSHNVVLGEFTSCIYSLARKKEIDVHGTKQPVTILLFNLKRNFYFCTFVKILTKLRPCDTRFKILFRNWLTTLTFSALKHLNVSLKYFVYFL